jgi:predicted regulator of Ras-like GTPase activity (Roadblock/LC7/MglB family)
VDLVESLATLMTEEGLAVAFVVGRDGLLIEGQSRTGDMDLEPLAAMATRAVLEMERLGRTIGSGNLSQMRLRFDHYLLLIEVLSASDVLVAGVESASGSERLLDAMARHRYQIQEALNNL